MNPFLHGAALPFPVLNIGHRGCGAAPENTIAAFSFGFAAGAHAVECDLRTSKDGAIVVMHDETIDRTTGIGGNNRVDAMTLADLKALDAGAGTGSIPTLRETLDFVRAHPNGYLNLEIKAADAKEIVRQVDETGMVERVILSSFDPTWVLMTKRLRPDIAVAALQEIPDLNFARYARLSLKADIVGPSRELATPDFIAGALKLGLGVHVWTVNDPVEMKELIHAGVTGIFTDRPERLGRVITHA
jgi:glycerophosphoryl diester phosphodiesterase